jgi:hypothetical protein
MQNRTPFYRQHQAVATTGTTMKYLFLILFFASFTLNLFGQDKIYDVVEKQPEFPGGGSALLSFFGKNLKYPDTLTRMNIACGKIFIKFIVEKNGTVKYESCKTVCQAICVEARKVIVKMPKWKPAEYKGKKARYCVGRDILSRPKNLGFAIRYC